MNGNRERFKIWFGFFIVSTVWGSTWLAIKIGVERIPPFLAAAVRFVIASAILYAIIRFRGLVITRTPDAKKLYLAMGILSFSIPFALVYWAEQYIPSGLASILFAAFPFWVAIFSHVMLRNEPVDGFKLAGIVMGFAGILIIFWGDFTLDNSLAAIGMGAMVFSTVLQAYCLILIKRLGHAISPYVMNFVGMAMGAGCLMALSLATERWEGITWDAAALLSILYLALIGSVVTFVTYYCLLKRIQAVYLSLTSLINPIVAVLLGALVLDETLGASVSAGAGLVLVGIVVANGRNLVRGRA
ncbi:MAG: EamA family transporter [Bacteroidota bacterium]